jgi:hypothetical protein
MRKMLILFSVIAFAVSPNVAQKIDSLFLLPGDGIESGQIRLANLVADAPMLDIYINGELSNIEPLVYGDMSGWVEFPIGQYEIAFVPVGARLEEALMNPFIVDIAPDSWLTIAATGSLETAQLETQLIIENLNTALIPNTARLTIFFDVEGVSAINILANEEILFTGMQAESVVGSAGLDMPVGVYTLQFVRADASQTFIASVEINLAADTANLVMVTGTAESPQIVVEVTDMGELGEHVDTSPTPTVGR